MGMRIDLTGQRFGRWTVVAFARAEQSHVWWLCLCDCGEQKVVRGGDLRRGHSFSCGCFNRACAVLNRLEFAGQRFGRLTAVFARADRRGEAHWSCVCDCGNEVVVRAGHLRDGSTRSCGCLKNELTSTRMLTQRYALKPGHVRRGGSARSREYRSWDAMRARCTNRKCKDFPDYGGRGITVCDHWKSFANFLADMGPKPSPQHSIDRRDNDGNYEPGNCRWATALEQRHNRRDSRKAA